ncbi:hypothetical protein L1887_48416 [Cichorium endivia]|nr:hypothetical protein L1887_48416 [Cichorium endivia]
MRGGGEFAHYCFGEFGGRIIAVPQAIVGFRTTPLFHQRSNPLPPPSLAKQLYQARPAEQSAIGSLRNICALRVASFLTLVQTQVRNHSFAALPGSTAALPPTDPPLSERLPISSSDFGAITGAISVKLQCRTLVGSLAFFSLSRISQGLTSSAGSADGHHDTDRLVSSLHGQSHELAERSASVRGYNSFIRNERQRARKRTFRERIEAERADTKAAIASPPAMAHGHFRSRQLGFLVWPFFLECCTHCGFSMARSDDNDGGDNGGWDHRICRDSSCAGWLCNFFSAAEVLLSAQQRQSRRARVSGPLPQSLLCRNPAFSSQVGSRPFGAGRVRERRRGASARTERRERGRRAGANQPWPEWLRAVCGGGAHRKIFLLEVLRVPKSVQFAAQTPGPSFLSDTTARHGHRP